MIPVLRPMAYVLALACVVFAVPARAQKAMLQAPNFDVVSIRPNNTGSGSISVSIDDDHFKMTNVTFAIMLMNAYNLRPAQLVNLPPWAKTDHFDVQGKILEPDLKMLEKLTPEQRRPAFQAILKERFGLQFHMESKNMPVYELSIAKGGPQIKALPEQTDAEKEAESKDPTPGSGRGNMNVHNDAEGVVVSAGGVKMLQLVATLSNFAGRTVVDKTGLTAEYTFQLRWLPEDNPSGGRSEAGVGSEPLPSLFTAIQEQLGLRLVAARGDVETMVIDHADHPTEN